MVFGNYSMDDIRKAAEEAMREANADTSEELTEKFQKHLEDGGIPAKAAAKSRVKFDSDSNSYKPDVPYAVMQHSLGKNGEKPSGVIPKFFNRLSDTEITKIHSKHLLKRSQGSGLA